MRNLVMADDLIATVPKSKREEIRVSLSECEGRKLLNVRVWFQAEDGEKRPGKAGLAFKIEKLPDFADAISLALEKARAKGLV
jgi:hypothetical protein